MVAALRECSRRGIDLYVPDNNLRHEMTSGKAAGGIGRRAIRDPEHSADAGEVAQCGGPEDVATKASGSGTGDWDTESTTRDAADSGRRGLEAVNTEWIMAAIAHNIGRLHQR